MVAANFSWPMTRRHVGRFAKSVAGREIVV
jgi:hypothetical protein